MRGSAFWPAVLVLLTLAPALMSTPGRAANAHNFVLAASDGYGVQDCLAESGECGRAVAEAWCAAQGSARVISFGRTDASSADPGPYYITCGD
jgi:hypothetical protein